MQIILTLMPSCLCVVGPLVSLFSCSVRWIPFVRKFVLVALSALGFVFPTFNLTFWKSSCLFFFLDFISVVYTAKDVNRQAGETDCIDLKNHNNRLNVYSWWFRYIDKNTAYKSINNVKGATYKLARRALWQQHVWLFVCLFVSIYNGRKCWLK